MKENLKRMRSAKMRSKSRHSLSFSLVSLFREIFVKRSIENPYVIGAFPSPPGYSLLYNHRYETWQLNRQPTDGKDKTITLGVSDNIGCEKHKGKKLVLSFNEATFFALWLSSSPESYASFKIAKKYGVFYQSIQWIEQSAQPVKIFGANGQEVNPFPRYIPPYWFQNMENILMSIKSDDELKKELKDLEEKEKRRKKSMDSPEITLPVIFAMIDEAKKDIKDDSLDCSFSFNGMFNKDDMATEKINNFTKEVNNEAISTGYSRLSRIKVVKKLKDLKSSSNDDGYS